MSKTAINRLSGSSAFLVHATDANRSTPPARSIDLARARAATAHTRQPTVPKVQKPNRHGG